MIVDWVAVHVIVALLIGGAGSRSVNVCPQHRGLPNGLVRGENKIRSRALYRLDVRQATHGFDPGHRYKFRVHTTYRKSKFSDATFIVEALDEKCGYGRLIVDSDRLYSPEHCPDIVTTQEKQPMGRAHFTWEAPKCGCVHFRVRVHTHDDKYYLADDKDITGPLARTICSKETEVPVSASIEQLPRVEKLQMLCKAWQGQSADQMLKHKTFTDQRGVVIKSQFDLDRLAMAIELRKTNTLDCCSLKGHDMLECFGDLRRHRIDGFCGTGEPDIPLSKKRNDWIRNKESECCWRIGEARYSCFNYTLDKDMVMDDDSRRPAPGQLRVNMDDFDPANDINDFGPEHFPQRHDDISKKPTKEGQQKKQSEKVKGLKDNDKTDKKDAENADETDADKTDADKTNIDNANITVANADTTYMNLTDVDNADETDVNKTDIDNADTTDADKMDVDNTDKTVDEDDRTDAGNADTTEDDHADEKYDDKADGDGIDDADVTDNLESDRATPMVLTRESCCLNGITAGTKVAPEGLEGCFRVANILMKRTALWNERCDRSFVICCMKVVDGSHRLDFPSNNLPLDLGKTFSKNLRLRNKLHRKLHHNFKHSRNQHDAIRVTVSPRKFHDKPLPDMNTLKLSNIVLNGHSQPNLKCITVERTPGLSICLNDKADTKTNKAIVVHRPSTENKVTNETKAKHSSLSDSKRTNRHKGRSRRRNKSKINRLSRHQTKRMNKYSKWLRKQERRRYYNTILKDLNNALDST